MNDIIDEATAAAVLYILEHLAALPADQGRVELFFRDILVAFAFVVAEEERKRIVKPSQN